jgi:hypothetical protein
MIYTTIFTMIFTTEDTEERRSYMYMRSYVYKMNLRVFRVLRGK